MKSVLEDLNPEQKQAVTTTEGPLLIVAGAGTGKTTVISRRIAYLIEKKLAKPSEILALTFTEKAAAEMEERVDVLVPYGYVDTWISTFHAFGDRVLREKALEIGLPTDFQVLTKPQQILFVQQNLFAFELNIFRPLSSPTKFIEAILALISRAKDENISPQDYLQYTTTLEKKVRSSSGEEKKELADELLRQKELASFYTKYEELKRSSGKIDYGDQVYLTLKLLREKPKLLKDYQQRFKYILVDEYQDTNYAQNELVKLLANSHKNICVVGDDDQSIYKFRGASISNILKFKQDYKKTKQVVLNQNYRSSQNLLDATYRLIQFNNPDRLEVKNKIDKKLKSVRKGALDPPKEVSFQTLSEEADFVAAEIARLVGDKKTEYRDIAILVRANSQADNFIRSLNLKGIPYKFSGNSSLYSQPEIGLLISFLNSLSNFDDSLSIYNLAVSEIYQLPLKDCITLANIARRKNRSLNYIFQNLAQLEEIEISEEGKSIVEKINKDIEELLELSRKENVGRVLYKFLEKTGYLKRLEREGSVESLLKIQNIAKFFDKVREFIDLVRNESVKAFVDYLETMRQVGDDPAAADFDPELDAVSVLTVHAAKGLEFPVVFMVGLVSDRFPSRDRAEQLPLPEELIKEILPSGDFHIQEERRLFYVGSTRAKDKLYYTWSRETGGKRLKKISPFVLEALDRPETEGRIVVRDVKEKIEQFNFAEKAKAILPQNNKRIIELSQGSIDDYETCAYKYRYAHVLRLPILRHHAVVYGFSLHAAVADFWQLRLSEQKPTLEHLYEVLENTWINEGFLTAEHEEQRLLQAKSVIKNFFDREKNSKELPTYIEKPLRFSLKNAEVSVVISGRYDRVDVKGKEVRIIDYKSTENRTQEELEKNAKDSIQLKVYTLAYYKNYGVVPDFVGIYDLDSGLVGGYKPTLERIQETEDEVIEVAKNIQKNLQTDNFPAKPKYFGRLPACNYCAYNSICPFSLVKK